jgi:hypothetical protein
MIERLIICWHVLTMHTYACFFCNKKMTKQRCYEENTFDVFNKTIADFASNNYDIEAYERSKHNHQRSKV